MKKTALIVLSLISLNAFSGPGHEYSFIDPMDPRGCQIIPSEIKYSQKAYSQSKSKKKFLDTIEMVKSAMKPAIKASGVDVAWTVDWEGQVENAFANDLGGNKRVLYIFGGLFRNPAITPESFTFVLCHELGHILAGAPHHAAIPKLSAEGQSDYYATNVCLPAVFKGQNNEAFIERLNVPLLIKKRCDSSWKTKEESAICQRSIMASYDLFRFTAKLKEEKVDLLQRDKERADVMETYGYPTNQCRLDTTIAGAYCNKGPRSTDRSGAPSNCSSHQLLNRNASRPECWYIR